MLCLRSKPEGHPQTEIRPLDNFDAQVDVLFKQERKRWQCLIVRSARYLNWRFFRRPGRRYYAAGVFSGNQLVGYSIYKMFRTPEQTLGDIIDVFCVQEGDVFIDLIVWTVQELFRQGAQAVDMWMNEHSPFHPALWGLGFQPSAPYTFFGKRVFSSILPAKRLAQWTSWHIQMGDSDVY
jgi:hypothetical protein